MNYDCKTPYYIIDKEELDGNYEKLERSLIKYWNNYIIGYSYKTNALPWLIKHMDLLGSYAEVVSEEEYQLAKLIGVAEDRIIYNGPIKSITTFTEALNNDCIVNIDSQREIDWLTYNSAEKRKIGIRVNFDIEKMCPGQSQCPEEGGRFGFCYENGELAKALERIKTVGGKVVGLHLHVSSKTRCLDIYRAIAEMACKIQEEYMMDLEYIDVGGGFFGGLPNKPQYDDYFSMLSDILKNNFDSAKTKLIVEPGMAIIGAPVRYVTSVIDIKDTTYNRFVVTDGTRTSIDPLMNKKSYDHFYIRHGEEKLISKQIICGYTCMEHDRLFESINEPILSVGDKIVYNKVGAYTMCLTPLFIKYFPDVYVEEKGQIYIVRDAWDANEYLAKSRKYI